MSEQEKMSALEFIERLAAKQLIPPKMVAKLQHQIAQSPKRVSARSVANLLVEKGQLTVSQAEQLLAARPAPRTPPPLASADEELGLAPIEELGLAPDRPSKSDELEVVDDLVDIDEDDRRPVVVVEPLPESDETLARDAVVEEGHREGLEPSPSDRDDEGHLLSDVADHATAGRAIVTKRRGVGGWLAGLGLTGGPRKYTANRWDSPLMLVGGGALVVMIAVGLALYFFLSRGTGDEAFNAARDSYRQQSYGPAITGFQQFLDQYPDHPQASTAKVLIGMARIRNDVEQKRWQEALDAVKKELPALLNEDAFSEARSELGSLLPEIMEGFADQALKADDAAVSEQLLARANETLEQVNNSAYLPTSVRTGQQARIEQILAKLESVTRRINRDHELARTVAQIKSAAADHQIANAYALRKKLLKSYPDLEIDQRLVAVVQEVATTECSAVELLAEPPQPLNDEPSSATQYHIALANRRGGQVTELVDQVVFVTTQGAVYGLRADDGGLLWRRSVGFGDDVPPIDLSEVGDRGAVVVDRRRQELVRLDAMTGKTVWRLPCPGQPTRPQLFGNRLWLACRDGERGHVMAVDPATGRVLGGATLPVPVSVSPAIDLDNQRLIQPAAHSSVYVLSTQDWSCLGVSYLGHSLDTIVVSPTVVAGAILVAENPGIDFSLLHVFRYGAKEPGKLEPMAEPLRMGGQVVVQPRSFGRRLLLTTDRGTIQALELDPSQATSPLRPSASVVATVPPGTASHFLLDEGRLWVADMQLTRYELQTSRGQLVRKWLHFKGDRFVSPLERRGSTLFLARQRTGKLGSTVAAVHVGDDRPGAREGESIWEVDLGVPAAGEPFVQRAAQEINVVNGNGALFAVGRDAIRTGLVSGARQQSLDPQLPPLVETLVLSDQLRVICPRAGADRVVRLDTSGSEPSLTSVTLDFSGPRSATVPVAFQQRLAVPTTAGAVYLLDPMTGKPAMPPFQPAMSSGADVAWQRPIVTDSGDELVVADNRGSLYRLAIATEPMPHLAANRQVPTDAPLVAPPVVLGSSIWAVVQAGQHDVMRRLSGDDLQMQGQTDLPGRVIWGPRAVGTRALLMTDLLRLVAVDETQQTFVIDTLTAPAVGSPVAYERGLVLATVDGFLWYLDGDSGQVLNKVEVGETLGTGPVHFSGDRFIVCGGDGTIHVVALSGA